LKRWREYSSIVARAAKNILGDKLESIYIVGGVAEDRITVYSDIDIVIVVRDPGLKSLDTILDIMAEAGRLGLPLEAPIDLKIITMEEFRENLEKIYKKAVKIEP